MIKNLTYKVPAGMLKAVGAEVSEVGWRADVYQYDIERMLKIALRWLDSKLVNLDDHQPASQAAQDYIKGFNAAIEAVRMQYLVPEENPVISRVKQQLSGCTLTAGDAVELIDAIRSCVREEPR